jgi:hypothetical protein
MVASGRLSVSRFSHGQTSIVPGGRLLGTLLFSRFEVRLGWPATELVGLIL